MFAPCVRVQCQGRTYDLVPGDIVGRGRTAALSIDDGRVSEAHALVSLRGGELKLLALRGRFELEERSLVSTVLVPGQSLSLAPDVVLEVIDVRLPDSVLAIRTPHLPETTLMGVCSLLEPDSDRLVPGFHRDAAAQFWNRGVDWSIRTPGSEADTLAPGRAYDVGVPLEALSIQLGAAGASATELDANNRHALRIVAKYDTVSIERGDGHNLYLNGIAARIVSELAEIGGPVDWQVLAREVWGTTYERVLMRRKWDVAVARLRRRLRDGGISPNIIMADGKGNFELLLSSADQVEVCA